MTAPGLHLITDIGGISLPLSPEERSVLAVGGQRQGGLWEPHVTAATPSPSHTQSRSGSSPPLPGRLEEPRWPGRGPCPSQASAPLEAASLPGQEPFLSTGRAQHRQVES